MQTTNTSTPTSAITLQPWTIRLLPVIVLRPSIITQHPGAITDAATRKSVDDKLNAALINLVGQSINVDDPELDKLITGLKLSYKTVQQLTVDALIKKYIVPPMLKSRTLYALGKILQRRADKADAPTVAVLLRLSTPLAEHPLFVTDVRQGKGRELLRMAKLSENLVTKIDAQEKALEAWNDSDWANAVTTKVLTPAQKNTLFFTTELSRLTGEHYTLVDSLHKANVNTLTDLLKWDKAQLADHLRKNKITAPDRLTPDAYAEQLAKNIRTTFPSEYLALRIADKALAESAVRLWSALKPLLKNNPGLLNDPANENIDWTGIKVADQKILAAKLQEFAGIVNTYRHLGLQEILGDKKKSAAQQQAEIGKRVDALKRFLQNNAGEDLRFLNLFEQPAARTDSAKTTAISWTGIAAADQLPVRNQLLAYQRLLHLSSDYETVSALLKAGLDSSAAAGNISYPAFLKKTGLTETNAFPVYQNALHRSSQIAHGIQLKKDAFSSLEQGRLFQGVNPAFINDLKDIPGYADLFGSTSYCECAHCRSIFSPGAYFTDLMYFIEQNITNKAFIGKPKHPIRLDMRRPDLWHLPLTCANTDTLIPHLALVIEILEAYLQHTLNVQNIETKLVTDRTAIGLPYHRPLETVRQYLSDWNMNLSDIYALLNVPAATIRKEKLLLSDEEWTGLTASATDIAWIRFDTAAHTKMDVVDFLGFTGITRSQLDELKATTTAGGFTVVKIKLSNDIQSEKEEVQGLSDGLLDRIGRFLRLQRKTGYTITELDELLQCGKITQANKFSVKSLEGVARFKQLQQALSLPVEAAMSVLDHIPMRALQPGGTALYTAIGIPAFTAGSAFPISFHHAHFNTSSNNSDTLVDDRLPALLNILGITEAELLGLFAQYSGVIVFSNKGDVKLTLDHITLLYAHVTLAKATGLSPAELSLVVDELFAFPGNDFRNMDALEQLQSRIAQLQKLPFSIEEFFSLLNPAVSLVTDAQLIQTIADLQKSGARLFAPPMLNAVPGISTSDSLAIFDALENCPVPLIVKEGDKYALTAAYTPATDLQNVLPAAFVALKQALHKAFMAYHFTNLLPNYFASLTGLQPDKALIALAYAPAGWDDAAILTALKTPLLNGAAQQPADLVPLLALANSLVRATTLLDRLNLETADYWFIAQYPALFGIPDIRQLSLDDLSNLQRYRQLYEAGTFAPGEWQNLLWQYHVRTHGNNALAPATVFSASAATVPVFAKALADPSLQPFTPGAAPVVSSETLVSSPLNDEEIKLLAKKYNLDPILLRSIFLSQTLPEMATDGIAQAFTLLTCCNTLRIQGHSLSKLLPRDFNKLSDAAQLLWTLLNDKYPDADAKEKHIDGYTDTLNMLMRDALCDYIIARSSTFKFKDREDLYNYFLIDVDMAGCFRTSRLVAAISSLQLYVDRCLINLEQSQKDNFSVLSFINSESVSQEWEWRKNYRVWEANRKVFLYPENYMDPDLRDDKTPLFEELEENLLQRTITLHAAEEAYTNYLSGFSEISQLKIAGAYFDKNIKYPEKECYYFFGRTHNDPYQYYFRRYYTKTQVWEAWQKMDLAISAAYVSPIVHLGRLYIFWVDVTSMDKSRFIDGNSIFLGIGHKITLHYSHLLENNRWSAPQKKTYGEFSDHCFIDSTPAFIRDIASFKFVTVDKVKSVEIANYYQRTKTYGKIFATSDLGDEQEKLTIHYYRKYKRSQVVIRTSEPLLDKNGHPVLDGNNIPKFHDVDSDPLPDDKLDDCYVSADGGKIIFKKPNPDYSFQYIKKTLDLVTNELADQETVNASVDQHSTESGFYNASTGVEAIGILVDNNDDDPSFFTLMLRNYALPAYPAATDAMLVSYWQKNGVFVSNGISSKNKHDMQFVNNRPQDTLLLSWKNQHWIHLVDDGKNVGPRRIATRINSTLASQLSKTLFTEGIDRFLSLDIQTSTGESLLLQDTVKSTEFDFVHDLYKRIPFNGSYGQYYRELFFHIPFLIASHLNADGQYREAKYWYEKIFNPTAQPTPADSNEKDRVWRYLEFRDVEVPKLKEILTDDSTIELYKKDPFNPFAIARLRMSAFQKCIVMKYIDNLVDWADDLFTQDTMESINEATMLYVLAYELLGRRPVSTGKCDNANEQTLTYELLGPAIKKGSEFLQYIENIYLQFGVEAQVRKTQPLKGAVTNVRSSSVRNSNLGTINAFRTQPRFETYSAFSNRLSAVNEAPQFAAAGNRERPEMSILRQYLPAFCVPPNENLLEFWDRLEDRLFKIRNCMNIDGEKRRLALFQPPIDPMLLVRAKAAGLSIEDIISQLNEALPPYRFSYLVEKARQYTSTVQSFGSALLSALEKKDGEALTLLRSVHEQNILSMTRAMKKQHIEEANTSLQGLYSTQKNVQNRIDYYSGLIQTGLTTWESLEQDSKHIAAGIRGMQSGVTVLATIAYLIPQLGSPFAMKYGGKEAGDSAKSNAEFLKVIAETADNVAISAGIIAHNERRSQEWEQQLKLAQEELIQVTKQILAAEIRVNIAEKDLEIHEKQIEHAKELHDFYTSKFTNLGLYKFMSTQLGKLYREAYQMAAQLARQAERAYQFERDATDFFIQGDNWQSDKSGLLSGERLLLQLQRMEKAYMERNYRELEISQSFSLQQIKPRALEELQRTGKCTFDLDELFFDLYYPGHYRRMIKSVRLTIPCVTGPYTNIGAKLTLNSSKIRHTPQLNPGPVDVPLTMTNTIATSQAQNDAGVFELSFRDERYLPFEGAGAISSWTLSLPSKVRMFNYASLSDVIVHISYVSKHDGVFETTVENGIVKALQDYSSDPQHGLFREISLRHEFPDAYYQLMNPVSGQPKHTSFTLETKHFPVAFSGLKLRVTTIEVWPRPVKDKIVVTPAALKINNNVVGNWAPDGTGAITNQNFDPLTGWAIDAGANDLNKDTVDDLVILVKYKIIP